MPFTIDVRTVIFALFVGNLVSALLVWAYARGQQSGPAYRAFLVGKVLQSVAWLLLGMRGQLSDVVTVLVANPLIFFGFGLESFALLALHRHPLRRMFAVYFVSLTLGSLFYDVAQSWNPKFQVGLAAMISGCVYLAPAVFFLGGSGGSLLRRTMGLLYLLSSLALWFRATAALLAEMSFTLISNQAVQTFSFLPTYLLMLLGSVGFLLLLKEHADTALTRAATRDGLTGLLNRKTFLEQAENMLALSLRRGEPSSMLIMDLDHFKKVNDTFGHPEGDRVLKDFADTVAELLRRYDVFGRYGGEEFVAFLPNTGGGEARFAAERVRTAVEARTLSAKSGKPLRYTVSIGICTSDPETGTSLGEMLRAGDQALYVAKDLGRNCVAQCGTAELQPLA
ncbi:MAG: GGDEF domain-containing protein [Desulfovibrio sp.]